MKAPRVYGDFHNADLEERVRLNSAGTTKDLAQERLVLRPGVLLTVGFNSPAADFIARFGQGPHPSFRHGLRRVTTVKLLIDTVLPPFHCLNQKLRRK